MAALRAAICPPIMLLSYTNRGVPPASAISSSTGCPPIMSWPSSLAEKCGGIGPVGFIIAPLLTPLLGRYGFILHRSEIFLRVERGHAAGPGSGHRLARDLVHHVSAGEHARYARPR